MSMSASPAGSTACGGASSNGGGGQSSADNNNNNNNNNTSVSSGGGGGGVRQYTLILAWVLAWWFASNTLTLLNRHILVVLRFHHPIIVASLGMFSTFVFSSLKRRYAASSSAGGDGDPNYRKSPSLSREFIIKNVLPISFAAGLCLSTAQIPYFYMSVSLIQMLKSIVPLFSMVMGLLVGA